MAYYWEVVNTQTGELAQHGIAFEYPQDAIDRAKGYVREQWGPGTYTVRLYTKSPEERWPAVPGIPDSVHTEEFTVSPCWYVTVDWGPPAGADGPEEFMDIDDALRRARSLLVNNRDYLRVQGGHVTIYPGPDEES